MELEDQITRFTRDRGYAPRVICASQMDKDELLETWKRYALLLSEREGYSYTLFKLATDGYLLTRSCEQDFFHHFPGNGWFLRPVGWYLGSTHLGWTIGHSPNQMRWFFARWRMGDPPYRDHMLNEINHMCL
jgi:hypothetical protein